jgi:hypothetical protein
MRRTRGPGVLLAAAAVALALAGCGGAAAGEAGKGANVTVTRDFGSARIGSVAQKRIPGGETVTSLMQRSFKIVTGPRKTVHSIDGHTGEPGRSRWYFYVNGIQSPKHPGKMPVSAGDQVWWDLHDSSAARLVPAVVGSYPQPFTGGIGGRRFPTVLDCAGNVTKACNMVGDSLNRAGVKVAFQQFGGGSGSDSLAVVVGTWRDLQGVIAAELIGAGPRSSGVYAQFVGPAGQVLELDNTQGSVVRTLRGGAGLIAATEQPTLNQPTWLITGTDVAGVEAAARALTPARLRDHFALAVDGSRDLPVPLTNP